MSRFNLYAIGTGTISLLLWFTEFGADAPRSGKIASAVLMFMGMCLFSHHFSSEISRRNPYADDFLKAFSCFGLTVILVVLLF